MNGPLAHTSYGKVRGFVRGGVNVFLGIPYGASTAAERRFLPPMPPEGWDGVREAITLGQCAPQGGPPLYTDELIGST